jgi:hypothetical protein
MIEANLFCQVVPGIQHHALERSFAEIQGKVNLCKQRSTMIQDATNFSQLLVWRVQDIEQPDFKEK